MLKVSFRGLYSRFLYRNISGVLNNGADEFQDSEEVYEAVGEVLQEVSSEKSEADIK